MSGEFVVLAVDVGSFTSDFAILEFNTKDFEDRPRIAEHSEPLGIDQLDREITALLSPEKAAILQAINLMNFERFKEIVYGKKKACVVKGIKIGNGEEGKQIRDCIAEFGHRIVQSLDKFLNSHRFGHIDEIILTGGGNMIRQIRSTLRNHLQASGGNGQALVHAYWSPSESASGANHKLEYRLVRGSSALGGGSVYLDFMV